jgi:parallel beta-helix repeat protein
MLLISTADASTLTVGSKEKYKTIQSAVNAAKDGDTIYVKAGTYNELVKINDKSLSFQGEKVKNTYKYPKVYGFQAGWTKDSKLGSIDGVNGFTITRDGVDLGLCGGSLIRNNYFYNCGVYCVSQTCSENVIMNNKFSGNYNYDGVYTQESYDNTITGNTFSKADHAIVIRWSSTFKTISKNTFNGCNVAVWCNYKPSVLLGNTYKGNKVNVKVDDRLD